MTQPHHLGLMQMAQHAFATLVCMWLCASCLHGASPPATIPVVRTWHELLSSAPISVGDATVRVGIQCDECPVNSGVLLYCLTDGWSMPKSWIPDHELGPLTIAIEHGGRPESAVRLLHGMHGRIIDEGATGTLLFTQRIVVAENMLRSDADEDRCHVLLLYDNRRIASRMLHTTRRRYQPWLPLHLVSRLDQCDFVVSNIGQGIGLPVWLGMRPTVFEGQILGRQVKRDRTDLLPRFVPERSSDALTLFLDKRTLVVTSRDLPIGKYGPSFHFLARWWVNDEPLFVEQAASAERTCPIASAAGISDGCRTMHLRMRFDYLALNCLPGDRIGVQLLYCDDGWDWVSDESSWAQKSWERNVPPMLTNRVDFVAWSSAETKK